MKTLFSRILLAQVVAVVLALLVVTVITRVSLGRSFKDFLETQEPNVLQTLVPVFSDLYESRGGWEFLRDEPRNWQRIWRLSRPQPGDSRPGGPGPRRGERREHAGPSPQRQIEPQLLRWMGPPERGMFRDRLFLLDENRAWVTGAEIEPSHVGAIEAVEVDGLTVGWIGFAPMGKAMPPEALRFLAGQIRIMAIAFVIALVVAAALAWLLARRVSNPVRQLGDTVTELSRGDYRSRVPFESRDETGILAGHVNLLAETLEKSRTARQRWMADIAHELRTPVSILKGEVEALADGIRPADERMWASLKEEIDLLGKLVDDLQVLALSDAGALNIHKVPVDLSKLVLQCVAPFRDRLGARGISLDLQPGETVTAMADPPRLRQMLFNLLENSCRYVEQGGRIRLVLGHDRGAAELLLEDSGPGLESEQIQNLFDRFYRVEAGRSRSGGGTGLGLSICRSIAEAHGGSIQAEPSGMGGLKIRVSLPA